MELYDSLGRKVQALGKEKTNSIERLAAGVYFLKIKTDQNDYIEKIIKK